MKNALRVKTRGAFFFACILYSWVFSPALVLAGNCKPSELNRGRGESVSVKYAYDGDTLNLNDGRRIRLIGVNTPERGRKGKPDEALALAAKEALELALRGSGARRPDLRLYLGRENTDNYGRHLAHVFVDDQNLAETLLGKGLGWHVVIPPNTGLAACLGAVEQRARRQGKGLWRLSLPTYIDAKSIRHGGYQRVRGRVRKVSFSQAWWINFDDGFVAVIYPENQHYFDKSTVSAWRGRRLEIEGWVYSSKYRGKQQWRIKLATPHGMSVL